MCLGGAFGGVHPGTRHCSFKAPLFPQSSSPENQKPSPLNKEDGASTVPQAIYSERVSFHPVYTHDEVMAVKVRSASSNLMIVPLTHSS